MEELEADIRRQNGEEFRDDTPVDGDIADMSSDFGIRIEKVS